MSLDTLAIHHPRSLKQGPCHVAPQVSTALVATPGIWCIAVLTLAIVVTASLTLRNPPECSWKVHCAWLLKIKLPTSWFLFCLVSFMIFKISIC